VVEGMAEPEGNYAVDQFNTVAVDIRVEGQLSILSQLRLHSNF